MNLTSRHVRNQYCMGKFQQTDESILWITSQSACRWLRLLRIPLASAYINFFWSVSTFPELINGDVNFEEFLKIFQTSILHILYLVGWYFLKSCNVHFVYSFFCCLQLDTHTLKSLQFQEDRGGVINLLNSKCWNIEDGTAQPVNSDKAESKYWPNWSELADSIGILE